MGISELLADAASRCDPPNYSALAMRLGVAPSAVSNWRNGRALPDVVSCEKLAKITGKKALSVIAAVNEQREISADAKAVWRRLAAAAVVVLATGITAGHPAPAAGLNGLGSMHYANFLRLARFLSRQLRKAAYRFDATPCPARNRCHGSPALLAV